jgi:hypothetical protein
VTSTLGIRGIRAGCSLGPVALETKHRHTRRSRIREQPTSGQVGRPFPLRGFPASTGIVRGLRTDPGADLRERCGEAGGRFRLSV